MGQFYFLYSLVEIFQLNFHSLTKYNSMEYEKSPKKISNFFVSNFLREFVL